MQIRDLEQIAIEIRISIINMLTEAGSGHTGGSLGIVDVLTALYFSVMKIDPKNPKYEERDRFVLSPAHMVPALYATLAERGFFPKSELSTLRKFESRLQGHTERNLDIGVETTGGSLGQGVGIAVGMALAGKLRARMGQGKAFRVYCMTSDGECQEGAVWEAAMLAAKLRLDNLVFILDHNNIQLSGKVEDVMPGMNLKAKWEAFGWQVFEMDGNDLQNVIYTLNKVNLVTGSPTLLLSNTVPGKGVRFVENEWEWHGKVPDAEQRKEAVKQLQKLKDQLI